eukprot:g30035.t1
MSASVYDPLGPERAEQRYWQSVAKEVDDLESCLFQLDEQLAVLEQECGTPRPRKKRLAPVHRRNHSKEALQGLAQSTAQAATGAVVQSRSQRQLRLQLKALRRQRLEPAGKRSLKMLHVSPRYGKINAKVLGQVGQEDAWVAETPYPVFIPSKGRAKEAHLNWRAVHCFGDEAFDAETPAEADSPGALVVVVVEPAEAQAYRDAWPDMPLIVLPESEMGPAFARWSVQKLCTSFRAEIEGGYGPLQHMQYCWLIDDSITSFYSLEKLSEKALEEEQQRIQSQLQQVGAIVATTPLRRPLGRRTERCGEGAMFAKALLAVQKALRISLQLNPDFAKGWNNLACCLASKMNLNDSARALRKAVSLDPENPQYWANLAVLSQHLGDYATSKSAMSTALQIWPSMPEHRDCAWDMGRIYVGTSGWCGLHPRDFARHYDVVEFNWTFHERDSDVEHYRKVASELREMHLHAVLKGRMECLHGVCEALRDSLALRRFLRTVAKLGSWINSADPEMEKGFAISSALGKLRLFRAVREDKAVSLLHIAILAAAGAEVPVVQRLCSSLSLELECLDQVVREDLADLEQAIKNFATEEAN